MRCFPNILLRICCIAAVLPSYPLKLFSQENKHSRFYLFDAGVARAAEGFVDFSETPERKGFYLEGLVLNELRAYAEVHRKNWKLGHLAVPRVGDIDFIIETRRKSLSKKAQYVTLEVKYSKIWKPEFEKMSEHLREKDEARCLKRFAVYLGSKRLQRPSVDVWPLEQWVKALWKNELL